MLCMASIGMAACFGSGGAPPTEPPDIEATVEGSCCRGVAHRDPYSYGGLKRDDYCGNDSHAGSGAHTHADSRSHAQSRCHGGGEAGGHSCCVADLRARPGTHVSPRTGSHACTFTYSGSNLHSGYPRPTQRQRLCPPVLLVRRLLPLPRPAVISLSEMVRRARPAVVRIETATGNGSGVIFENPGTDRIRDYNSPRGGRVRSSYRCC